MTHFDSLLEHLIKTRDSLGFAIDDLRQALPHCRGELTTSSLLLMDDLKAAAALQQRIQAHLDALELPMTDEPPYSEDSHADNGPAFSGYAGQ